MIQLSASPLAPYELLADHERELNRSGKVGAAAHFIGTMRNHNQGAEVQSMYLEYYPEMTEKTIAQLCDWLVADYALLDCLIVHRVGEIKMDNTIVVLGCWASHRHQAFGACREGMEQLKRTVPLWKRERLVTGEERWVGGQSGQSGVPSTQGYLRK